MKASEAKALAAKATMATEMEVVANQTVLLAKSVLIKDGPNELVGAPDVYQHEQVLEELQKLYATEDDTDVYGFLILALELYGCTVANR